MVGEERGGESRRDWGLGSDNRGSNTIWQIRMQQASTLRNRKMKALLTMIRRYTRRDQEARAMRFRKMRTFKNSTK